MEMGFCLDHSHATIRGKSHRPREGKNISRKKPVIACLWMLCCGSVFGEEPCEVPTASDYSSASREPIDSPQGFVENLVNFGRISAKAKIEKYEQCLKQQEANLRREKLKAETEALRAETEAIKAETEALKAEADLRRKKLEAQTEALKNDARKLSGDADYRIDLGWVSDFESTRTLIEQCTDLGRLEVIRGPLESATDLEQLRATLESYGIVEFHGCPSGVSGPGILEASKPRIFSEEDFADAPKESVSGGLYSSIGKGHWVSKNLDSGYSIKLEDGSLWEISPIDRVDTSLWLVTEEITVTDSGNPMYPYKLINTDTEDVVEAKLLFK